MKSILIIDDDQALLTTLSAALQGEGYEVVTASTGEEGLRRAYERLPDLILCDIQMPDVDGTTVLQALRLDHSTADRQIVLMTGSTKAGNSLRSSMDLGADDFLAKPFSLPELMRCIQARLTRAELHSRVEANTYEDLRKALHSTLPHEFFTPLAGILGLSQLLRAEFREMPQDEIAELLQDIEGSAHRLHRTLSNYIKILDLESAAHEAPPRPLPGERTLEIVTQTALGVAERRDRANDLLMDCDPVPLAISEENLATVVEELLDNACAYSRKGSPVRLCMSRGDGLYRVQVSDEGRGMTEAQISRVGSFQQFDRHRTEQQGLGLGLALVRKLARAHGGGLTLASTPGHGTVCTLNWPIVPPRAQV